MSERARHERTYGRERRTARLRQQGDVHPVSDMNRNTCRLLSAGRDLRWYVCTTPFAVLLDLVLCGLCNSMRTKDELPTRVETPPH